jgi:hypothetical protein
MLMETIPGTFEHPTNELELLFTLELRYQGQIELAPMGDKVCALQVPGVIQTHDGAEIGFEGRELSSCVSRPMTAANCG